MPNETIITEIENLLSEVINLGGQNEQSKMVPNLTVQDASPAGLSNFIVVSDNRDGDNILAKAIPGIPYNNNDLVNVIFVDGGEAIAFQQGSGSPTGIGLWQLVGGTGPDIFYDDGEAGLGTSTIVSTFTVVKGEQNTGTGGAGANPGVIDATMAHIPISDGGAQLFISSNSDMAADLGGSLGFGARYLTAPDTRDRTFAKIFGGKETGVSGNANGYLTLITSSHDPDIQREGLRLNSLSDVGIGASTTISAQLHIDQTSATGAQPVLLLDQGDISEQCIQFSSDSADQDINLYTVDVTGTPTLLWDESEDAFSWNKAGHFFATVNEQLKLSFENGVKFADFTLDTNHDLTITPSSTGQIILQPTADSTDFFQVLDADGGTPIFNIDATNERAGISTSTPDFMLQIGDGSHAGGYVQDAFFNALFIGSDRNSGRLIIEGTIQADINLTDGGAAANDKTIQLLTVGGITEFRSLNDAAGEQVGKIIVMDHGTGNVGIGTDVPGVNLEILEEDSATNTITDVVIIGHDTDGSPAAGYGAGQLFQLESSTTIGQDAARVSALWATATHATRKARSVWSVFDTAEREGIRIEASGSAPMLGFYGVTAVVKPTALTSPLTQITHTGPGTPDYAIATPIDSGVGSAWGFSTQDEFETIMSVALNLQTRVDELETKIQSLGLLT